MREVVEEVEVFRLNPDKFTIGKCYEYGLVTRTVGQFPNDIHYTTTNNLVYAGQYIRSADYGGRSEGGGTFFYFNKNGEENRISTNREGTAACREVPCPRQGVSGGKRKSRRNRKNKKSRNNRRKSIRRR